MSEAFFSPISCSNRFIADMGDLSIDSMPLV